MQKATDALIDAEAALHQFKKTERMSKDGFCEKLTELVEVYEHLGGELGMSRILTDALLANPETSTAIEREGTHVHD